VEFCVAAGLNPLLIDVDAFALESVYERLGIPGGAAILNIGNKQTNLAVLENGVTRVVRDVLIGGGSFTKTISKNLSVDLAMAEEIKQRVGVKEVVVPAPKPPPTMPISPVIQTAAQTAASQDAAAEQAPPLSQDDQAAVIMAGIARDLAAEARRSIDFYISQASGRTVEKVYITGGGAVMPNLAKFLETEIKLPVEILSPLSVITSSDAEPVPPELASALTVAAGLAMRKLND
jgi:type IV pilus assembly protein PilM